MWAWIGSSLFVLIFVWKVLKYGSRERHLPPGPPTVPVLGNLHIFPTKNAHLKFTEWAQTYGDFYSLKIASGTAIVLSSAKSVREFMDKRSGNTADRPGMYTANLITDGTHMGTLSYTSETWRILRKTAHILLTPQKADKHIPIQRAEGIQLMHDFLRDPLNYQKHIKRAAYSGVIAVLYGKRSPRFENRDAREFFDSVRRFESSQATGTAPLIDLVPVLKYVPERWAKWKTECREIRETQQALYMKHLEECEENVRKGEEVGSFIEEVIRRQVELGMSRKMSAHLAGTLLEGGSDTTSSFLQSLVLALVAFPDTLRKAQEEMDSVVGAKQLPTIEDFAELPYVQAVIKECHRFRPTLPIAIPHATIEDDEYQGYLIPAKTTILMNTWGVYHDPTYYDDPDVFNPDRYLRNEFGTKPGVDASDFRNTFVFGSGRRICPGLHLANNIVALNVMFLVWGFNFSQAIDPVTKEPVPVDVWDYHPGLVVSPNPFKCSITPRSRQHAEIIEREFVACDGTFLLYEGRLSEEDKAWVARTRGKA